MRYNNVYKVRSATQAIPPLGTVVDRETDLYIPYNGADRLDTISYRVYGDPQYWWVILAANEYQIEFDIIEGEILRIPYPLTDVLNDMRDNIE